MSNLRVVYPGTFDPFTHGHNDIVRRAAHMFDQVTVAVAESQRKAPFFLLSDRVMMAKEVLADLHNVDVQSFDCLLNDFLGSIGTSCVLRGLRAASDFEFEFQMAGMNRRLNHEIETLFLTPDEKFMFVSATMVREIAWFGGDVGQFVHPLVEARIGARARELNPKLANA
ncbi:MAG: pantetheine-phosphate adenylyltransferase [Betaproteobacteria bacterium]